MPRKPHVECLLCRKQAGQQAKTVERHLHDCFLRGPASGPHTGRPSSQQGAGVAPTASAASAAPAAGGAAGWAGRAAAAGDRVLVLELTSQHLFRLTVLAAPHATFRDLRRLMLKLWLDCGCGHLCGFSRLAEPEAGPWSRGRHARTKRQASADRLGDVLRLPGEHLHFSYDMGDSTSVSIEVQETAASLNSVAAAWLGSRPLAAGLRNAHPGTVQRCGCGQPGRYLGESGAWCSKACAAAGGDEPRQLARWWNSPRMGACGYCGPDGVTPESFWPAEADCPDDDSGSEGGSEEGSQDDQAEEEEGGSVVSGISWGEADRMAADAQRQQQQAEASQAAQAVHLAAPPAAHAALFELAALQPAEAGGATEQQQRKRSAPGDAADAGEQPPLQRRREQQPAGGEAGAAGAAGAAPSADAAADAAAALTAAVAVLRPADMAASPTAAHRTAARDILAAPTLAGLQAAAAAAAVAQQQLQPLRQLVAGPHDVVAASLQCVMQTGLVFACLQAEEAWQRALSTYLDDLRLRLTSHLMAAECQRQVPPPARRGGRQAPRQRRMSAAAAPAAMAAGESAASMEDPRSERVAAIERAHQELDFKLMVQRVLDGPSLSTLQRAAWFGDVHGYAAAAAAAAAAPQPAQPAARRDPMSALHSRGWDVNGGSMPDPVSTLRWQAQRAALPAPHQVLGDTSDMLAMLAERASLRARHMEWYQEAPPALALWLAEWERREALRGAASARAR